ncbi:cation/acetate symporter [Amycolatopsis marina]|uniref:Cation/acetate symporter n=1 Tax=Amycolatopsis marina TaxID=490629 RepID=A0A1I1BCK8_9PSEU|nr:hypothetical protein [Amycolatopsis marina]SFB46253.1 cation/acetate symporter [Amycolatopsis marina]
MSRGYDERPPEGFFTGRRPGPGGWKRFNTTGVLRGIYGGLGACLILVFFSRVVLRLTRPDLPGVDFHWLPLRNPGLVSIPFSFLCGFPGTVPPGGQGRPAQAGEMEVRSLTGNRS